MERGGRGGGGQGKSWGVEGAGVGWGGVVGGRCKGKRQR